MLTLGDIDKLLTFDIDFIVVGGSVGLWVCPHVFSRTVAAGDTKRRYVVMCNRRSAQLESAAASFKNNMFTAGA